MSDKTELLRSLSIERTAAPASEGGGVSQYVLLGSVAAGALVIGGAIGWFAKPAPPPPPPPPPVATTQSAKPGPTAAGSLIASGYVVARRQATVAAEVTARVLEVRVEEGQKVTQGEILAVLEPTLAHAQFNSAQARVAAADADLAEANRILARTEKLVQSGYETTAALTAAQSKAQQALAQRNSARADAAAAGAELDRYEVKAPFSGVVTDKAAQPGEIISPISAGGGFTRTGICTIVDMASLEVEVDVAEAYISRVVPAGKVEAVLEAYPDVKFPAHVIAVIPAASRDRATFRVRIGFDKLDPRILPDMAINVTFLNDNKT